MFRPIVPYECRACPPPLPCTWLVEETMAWNSLGFRLVMAGAANGLQAATRFNPSFGGDPMTIKRLILSILLLLSLLAPVSANHRRHYYRNTYGHRVHSPVHARTVQRGATAECNDGTYSFSENHRGAYNHHGG